MSEQPTAEVRPGYLRLSPLATGRLAGVRAMAVSTRQRAEEILASGQEVVFDFTGIEVTQSFVDELVGHLILRDGPDQLDRILSPAPFK